jgi:hypothetical protein
MWQPCCCHSTSIFLQFDHWKNNCIKTEKMVKSKIVYESLRKDKMKCSRRCFRLEIMLAISSVVFSTLIYFKSKQFHWLPLNRTCLCADFGWDKDAWASLGESVRLLEFAVGDELENKTIFNIGEQDSFYFITHGAIVHTIESNARYSSFAQGNNFDWLYQVLHIYNVSSLDRLRKNDTTCWLKQFSGLTPISNGSYGTNTCHESQDPYILKSNHDFDSLLHNGVDLLHLRCNGCEYTFLFYLIYSGLVRNIIRLNFAINDLPGYHQLRCRLELELFSTHVPTYCAGMWQGWVRRGEHSKVDRHFSLPSPILPQILGAGSGLPVNHHIVHGSAAFTLVRVEAACPPAVLLLGDSVDRYVVRDFCEAQNLTYEDWSGRTFRYRYEDVSSGTSICQSPNGTLGHLHLFGTNATGPYRNNIFNNRWDPFVDTPLRICKGIEVFTRNVGPPAAIVFQTVLWDALAFSKQLWLPDEAKVEAFRAALLDRIRDIDRCRGHATELVLRTVPLSIWASGITALLNDVIRNTSAALGLRLLDWDTDIRAWASPKEDEIGIFRDAIHPSAKYCLRFAQKVLALKDCPEPGGPLPPLSESALEGAGLGPFEDKLGLLELASEPP